MLLICACFAPLSVHTHLAGQQASGGQLPLEPVKEKMARKNTLVGESKRHEAEVKECILCFVYCKGCPLLLCFRLFILAILQLKIAQHRCMIEQLYVFGAQKHF